jgi:hypothetical protein
MTSEELRKYFNANYTEARYARFRQLVEERCGCAVEFRLCETPCFFDWEFMRRCSMEGEQLIHQLEGAEYCEASEKAIPEQYRAPNEPASPLFVQVDFGVVRNQEGLLEPRLVEIQAFPSLYAFQPVLAQSYIDAHELPGDLHYLLDGLEMPAYRKILRESIVGDADPSEVILLEVDPDNQKTRCDFLVTEKMLGIRTVCITKLVKQGRRLFHRVDGRLVPVRRIYNRTIIDELQRRGATIPFDWRDDLDVEWAGHPNHYFRISKFSLPWLRHPSVPDSHFLNRVERIPADLENWVLKPLYSFAGLGVKIGPSGGDLAAIPERERGNWILQRRVEFTPVIETPHGYTKAEIRVMFIGGRPVTHIIRMGRGKMMGVDQNRDMEWVGASAALYPMEEPA